MNERIKEIGEKVGFYVENILPGGFPNEDLIAIEKFAELIIEECIEVIYNVERTPEGFIQPKNASVYEYELKEHFGITQ